MVSRIPVPSSRYAHGGETNVYLVGADEALLVDPGAWTDDLDARAREADVAHVAVTHHHPDHVGGVADAVDALDATLWARAGRTDEFTSATGCVPHRTFSPGDTLSIAGGVEVVDTPGHAPEHVSFATADGLLSGDLAVAEGSVVVGAPEGDMRAYLSSLRRVYARAPDRLYPGHLSVIDDPRATCRRLVEHRLARERRVERAVQSDAETVDAILDAAYDKDVSDVRKLARATVVAHLEKLAVEGRVRWDGERASRPDGEPTAAVRQRRARPAATRFSPLDRTFRRGIAGNGTGACAGAIGRRHRRRYRGNRLRVYALWRLL